MSDWFLLIKLIHILSATVLFGTGMGTAFYMWRADRGNNISVIREVSRNVVRADWLFTAPAVLVQLVSGLAMAHLVGWPISTPWLTASLVLYFVVGLCWLPVVWIQIRVAALAAQTFEQNGSLSSEYRRYMRWWYGLGWPAFLAVIAIFYLMVFKPGLW